MPASMVHPSNLERHRAKPPCGLTDAPNDQKHDT